MTGESLRAMDGETLDKELAGLVFYSTLAQRSYAVIDEARRRLTEAQQGTWRSMDSAPKDGTRVLVAIDKRVKVAWWDDNCEWWTEDDEDWFGWNDAHLHNWMPLPAAPTTPERK